MKIHFSIEKIKTWHCFALACFFAGICASLHVLPSDDVFNRYAPAAESFARGDWLYAFHPRFGVCFTSLAGLWVWLFGISGVTACKIVSILFFASAVFPLNALFIKIWGKKIALYGIFCYIFCSHLIRYAGGGVRDNGKTLAMAFIALALTSILEKGSWKNVFELALGCALLTVIRGEGFLVAIVCMSAGVCLFKNLKKSVSCVVLFILFIFHQCFYNYCVIGYFVPEVRHGFILQKMGFSPTEAPVKIGENVP